MGRLRRRLIGLGLVVALLAPAGAGAETAEPLSPEDEELLDDIELLMLLDLLEDWELIETASTRVAEPEPAPAPEPEPEEEP